MKVAFFDIDGTLVAGTSTERLFFRWLWSRRLLGPRQWLAFVLFFGRGVLRYGPDVARKNKAYLAGLDEALVAREARDFVATVLPQRLNTACVAALRRHQASGDRVVLLTGTLGAIANAMAENLEVGEVIATRCAVADGRYLGAAPLRHPFGVAKRDLIDDYLSRHALGDRVSVAYGDSIHDRHALERVAEPVCVLPDPGLAELARERGWAVLGAPA